MFSQASVRHSVRNRAHGYSVTAHPCYGAVGKHPAGMLSSYVEYFRDGRVEIQRWFLTLKRRVVSNISHVMVQEVTFVFCTGD